MATALSSKPSPKRVEAAIQRELVRWIRKEYPHLMVQATLNELARKHVDMGIDVGITDLLIFDRRDAVLHVFFLELKTLKGKLQNSQKEWLDKYLHKYESSNTQYAVAYGLNEAKALINIWIKK